MKKVVLIGAGNIGKQALECLGAEFIEYFIDNNKAGQNYLEKSIYSINKIIEDQGKYLFLLTIAHIQYREELMDQLNRMGIKDYYYFEQAIYMGNIFQRFDVQVYTKKSLYEDMIGIDSKRVCVLGRERRIGRFIANLLEIENFYDETEFYVEYRLTDKYDYLFVNVKNYNSELHNRLKESNIKVYYIAHYYNFYNYLVRKGFKEFSGKYKERKRCFIVGNGPSLVSEDLDVLAEHNEFCIGSNMIHKMYSKTKWRPNYICICDKLVISQNLNHILENNNSPVFVNDAVRLYLSPFQYDNAILYHEAFNRDDDYRIVRFGTELSDGSIPSGWTVTYIAIELAIYMGFEEIYLLGIDNSNLAKHCCDDYWSESSVQKDQSEDELQLIVFGHAYKRVKAASIEFGFKIYNATRGGCLEEFERVNFDELF